MPYEDVNYFEVFKGMLQIINDPVLLGNKFHSVSYKLLKKNNGTDKCSFTLIYFLDGVESENYIVHDQFEYGGKYSYEFVQNRFWQRVVTHLMFFIKDESRKPFYER